HELEMPEHLLCPFPKYDQEVNIIDDDSLVDENAQIKEESVTKRSEIDEESEIEKLEFEVESETKEVTLIK
ncbi:3855_t:CDS:2, partial [Funneliformis geosporum]